jgi:hypothetical protein
MKSSIYKISFFLFLIKTTSVIQAQNTFSQLGGTISSSSISKMEMIDIDGDNDLDIVTGFIDLNIYINDGSGNYTLDASNSFTALTSSNFGIGDVNGDDAPDIIWTGFSGGIFNTELYTNNGSGTFTKVNGTPFIGVIQAEIEIVDLDGDTDNDIIIVGTGANSTDYNNVYVNDGSGNFTIVSSNAGLGTLPFSAGALEVADIDGDNDLDLLYHRTSSTAVQLFKNNGSNTFSLYQTLGSSISSVDALFVDVDGNNDLDLIYSPVNAPISLYLNDGSGNYTLKDNTSFLSATHAGGTVLATGDIDGDNDADVYLSTLNITNSTNEGGIFINDGGGNFYLDNSITAIDIVNFGNAVLADANGDNKVDLLLNGSNSSNAVTTKLYRNDFAGFGKAIDFDGTNTYTIPHLAAVNILPITFEFWAQATDNVTGFYSKNGANGSIRIRLLAGYFNFDYTGNSGGQVTLASTNTINDGQWHHYAVTLNTTECKLYIDGVLDGTANWTGIADAAANTDNITLGDQGGLIYNGLLDEFRIWNTVRTVNEITQNMCNSISSPASNANLIVYYTFDEYTSSVFLDKSSNYNPMTISANSITVAAEQTNCTAPNLPVELIYFKGQHTENGNSLTWQTASEENNHGFEIERSTNGSEWQTISFVNGNGTTMEISSYEFIDNENLLGLNLYYRLKQIDYDGNFEYSNIVNIEYRTRNSSHDRNGSNIEYRIFPNPATDYITIETNEPTTIQIINAHGQVLMEKNIQQTQSLDIRQLPKGIYYLVTSTNHSINSQKLIKQ